jgi:hypothetical protein
VARPSIRMSVEGCPPAWDPEIRLTVAVELGDERLATAPSDEQPATPDGARTGRAGGYTLNVRCEEQRVRVVARDSQTAVTLERTLTDLPDATAPRLIALVAVEQLTTFDPALRRRVEAPTTLSKPRPAAEPPAPAPPPARRLSLTAGWVYRTFLTTGGVQAWGGTLDGRRASQDGRWAAAVGVEIARDDQSTSLGQTSALLASAHASAGGHVPLARDRFLLSLDLGARAGIVRLAGSTDVANVDASTVFRPWAGPAARLRARAGASWFYAEIGVEAGWAAVSARGLVNAGAALAASGPWLALSLGLGSRG